MAIIDLKEYIHRQRKLNKRSMFQGNQSKRLKAKNEHMWKILMKYGDQVNVYKFEISDDQYIKFLTYDLSVKFLTYDPSSPLSIDQQAWLTKFSIPLTFDKDEDKK